MRRFAETTEKADGQRFAARDEGTIATSAGKEARMVQLAGVSLDRLWRLLDLPIRWLGDGSVEPELERPLEYLELAFFALVLGLIVVTLWDLTSKHVREHERRALQEQWRSQLEARRHRLKFVSGGAKNDDRHGPGR
jgi:hypothetical protein